MYEEPSVKSIYDVNTAMTEDEVLGSFKLGDLQEHRYAGQNNWVPDAVPHAVHWLRENPGNIINEKFDMDKKRFLTDDEYINKKIQQRDGKKDNAYEYTPKDLDRYIDDWTGTHYGKYPYTHGIEPFPPKADPMVPYDPPKDKDEDKPSEATVLWISSDL